MIKVRAYSLLLALLLAQSGLLLHELKADHLFAQVHCEVCVSGQHLDSGLAQLALPVPATAAVAEVVTPSFSKPLVSASASPYYGRAPPTV